MHDYILTETQKKLIFIPVVNISVLFIWVRNCRLMGVGLKDMLSGSLSVLACLLPFGLVQFLCSRFFESFATVCAWLVIYLAPMLMGYVLIDHQERMEQKMHSDEAKSNAFSKKNRMTVLIALIAAATIVVLAFGISMVVQSFGRNNIPDQNGAEDSSLAVLTRDDILSEQVRSVVIGGSTVKNGASTDVTGNSSEYDADRVRVSIGSISGVRTIHATKNQCDQVTLTVESELKAGNAALVVLVDGEYYCDVAINTTDSITVKDAAGKLIEVRLAGESAKIKISVSRSFY